MNKRLLAGALAVVMVLCGFTGCKPDNNDNNTAGNGQVSYQKTDLADAVEHTDYTSVYDTIGANITIDMVKEDTQTGLATVEYGGKTYELGMDFLSMAMVYNCTPAGDFTTAEEVYNAWWKLYMQRWNYLVPEVPLYSNQYFDLYNAKIENFVTSPYWDAADAIVAASVREGETNAVILGSSTNLSGAFRNASWGKSSPSSSDLDIQNLTTGYSTMMSDKDGVYQWNEYAIAEIPTATHNDDGTLTYTIKIRDDMVFSDGSGINAKNYIAGILANSTEIAAAAGGTGNAGMTLVGYDAFKAYNGEGDKVYFTGVKLIDEYTFSVTFTADYANYYYANTYAAFSPVPMALYLGGNDIVVAADGSCGLADGFYERVVKNGAETYAMVDTINANLAWDSNLPWSGPYTVSNYDASTLTATLTLNKNYPGDAARGKASIETIIYVKMVAETQTDMFKQGQIDVLAGITGAAETEAALALVNQSPDRYAETHYERAGYGKLAFRCDLGPAAMTEVRQAIMYTINRPEFAQTFTGGYGSVVHGPYYTGTAAYIANADELLLNQYAYSVDAAVATLEEGGWIYNEKGKTYNADTDAVRYKKLEGYELSGVNLQYASVDNVYRTVKIDGAYYMPLVINWYGTQPNAVTDQLITAWQANNNATGALGMYITYTSCDFNTGLYGEYLQMEGYGWDGVAKCTAINFATGFTSTIYDQAFNWTIDQSMYADYSTNYLMDEADFAENYR